MSDKAIYVEKMKEIRSICYAGIRGLPFSIKRAKKLLHDFPEEYKRIHLEEREKATYELQSFGK